jgi:nickel superoxide dismutase
MRTKLIWLNAAAFMILIGASHAAAHCEVPCGIYDDQLRANLIAEHSTTIEKSMKMIVKLSKADPVNYNQLVRWTNNKETHATQIQHIVSQYFMTQRIKPDQKKYAEKLAVLHKILISAMKCKQTTDPANVNTLRSLLNEFEILYFGHSLR